MQDRNTFKQAISEFSLAINEAVVNLTFKLSQGGKQPTISTGAPARAQSTRAAAAEKQSSSAATKDEDAEFEDKSHTPSGGYLEYAEESEDEPIVDCERRSKRKQDDGGKGQESSSEELEDYADSDSGNDWGEDGGEDWEDEPIVSRYAIINFSWIATFQRLCLLFHPSYIFFKLNFVTSFAQGYK